MNWTLGLIAGFVLMLGANAALIYLAVSGQDPVVPSYEAEAR